jgi:hypothetical protein
MAKAILGHVGLSPDVRLLQEVRRLQLRVKELETQLADVQAAQALEAAVATDFAIDREPAYSS